MVNGFHNLPGKYVCEVCGEKFRLKMNYTLHKCKGFNPKLEEKEEDKKDG